MQRISVIVPMYNEARHITRTLDSVLRAARAARSTLSRVRVM